MTIIQYNMNVDGEAFYTGSGFFYINGSSNVIFKPNLGKLIVKYDINEYVYDKNHKLWKIIKIYGSINQIYYLAFNGHEEKSFKENDLIDLAKAPYYFDVKFNNLIEKYTSKIDAIQDRIDNTIDTSEESHNFFAKLKIGQYAHDANNNVWRVIQVFNDVSKVFYLAEKDKKTKVFDDNTLFDYVNENQLKNQIYEEKISNYADKISKIQSLIDDKYS